MSSLVWKLNVVFQLNWDKNIKLYCWTNVL